MTPTPDPIAAIARALEGAKKEADRQYCWALDQFQKTPCLGAEYKMNNGLFGMVEHKAHESANRAMGRHFGAYETIRLIEPAIEDLLSLARQADEMKSALIELTDAASEMLKGLDARIQAAPGNAVPVFHGIVDLSDAFHRARSLTTEISDAQ